MRKLLFGLLCFLLIGCASVVENMPGFTHTAFLPIGASKSEVIPQVEHLFGSPINELHSSDGETFINEYNFTSEYNLLLYFYNDTFVQADLRSPKDKSKIYPPIREDYKTVSKKNPGPEGKGYLLTRGAKTSSIKTLR